MNTTRRKYAFKTRELAEQEVTRKSIEATRNYMVAIHYRDAMKTDRYRVGNFTCDLITHHATTGRELSMGPIAVLLDNTARQSCPEFVAAYDWKKKKKGKYLDTNDQDAHDYRQLAMEVYRALVKQNAKRDGNF